MPFSTFPAVNFADIMGHLYVKTIQTFYISFSSSFKSGSFAVFTPHISTLFNAIAQILLPDEFPSSRILLTITFCYSVRAKIKKVLLLDTDFICPHYPRAAFSNSSKISCCGGAVKRLTTTFSTIATKNAGSSS